ncbi:hypothetical protein V8F20_000293 [Naviculisporaceae sp. PSN 640]
MPESELADGSDMAGSPSVTDGGSKAYHAKRPHRKSRNGCKNCKRRKVKCDEGKPACRTCTLRRETCVYLATTSTSAAQSSASSSTRLPLSCSLPVHSVSPTRIQSQPSSSSESSSPRSTVSLSVSDSSSSSLESEQDLDLPLALPQSGQSSASPAPSAPSSQLQLQPRLLQEPVFIPTSRDLDDVKLLWAYSCTTYLSFVTQIEGVEKLEYVLRNKVLEYAITSPFLMDCVLALTSMHMDHLRLKDLAIPRTKSILYRARAFEGYRKAVEAGEPSTYPALVCCSLLLCALSSQMFLIEDRAVSRLYILNWIIVWRGIGMVLNLTTPKTLGESGLKDLFMRPPINLDLSAMHIPSNLLFMVSSIKPTDPDFSHVEVYYTTLKYLGSLYKELKENGFSPILDLRIITFYTFAPSEFVDLARKKRPRALVIIAHHLAFLKMAKSIWWTAGICDGQIRDVCEYLGDKERDRDKDEWRSLLTVPWAATKMTESEDIGRLLLDNHAWEPNGEKKTDGDWEGTVSKGFWSGVWVNNRGEVQDFFPERIESV